MRKAIVVFGIGFGLLAPSVATASAAPYVSVTDSSKQGELITIFAGNCESGGSYVAELKVEIYRQDGTAYHKQTYPTGEDGNTTINLLVDEIGTFSVYVDCIHKGVGTWYSEYEELIVTASSVAPTPTLTADELKMCKKKRTAEARRRCRKKQAAD